MALAAMEGGQGRSGEVVVAQDLRKWRNDG